MNQHCKRIFFVSLLSISLTQLSTSTIKAQGVGINSSGNPAASSAMLDVSATDKGLLMPRLTTSQRDAISSPVEGLIIFNTTTKCFEAYVMSSWNIVSCPRCVIPSVPGAITGDVIVCSGTSATYSISPVSGATSYTWTVPSGSTLDAGQGTTLISVTVGSAPGNISVTADNTCGSSPANTLAIAIASTTGSQVFNFTGGQQSFTVPPCITLITTKAWGGGGGGENACAATSGGGGGYSTSGMSVTPGEVFTIVVGQGGNYQPAATNGGSPVYGGGGLGSGLGYASQGGGLSGIFSGTSTLTFDAAGQARALVIAGGGGGAGCATHGGAGGGTNGVDGSGTNAGHGGTQTAGGAPSYAPGNTPAGTAMQGSSAGSTGDGGGGGGGGGGYYGGSCGWNGDNPIGNSGGGGGSGYAPNGTTIAGNGAIPANSGDPDRVTEGVGGGPGANGSNGLVVISWGCITPATPGAITGNTTACAGSSNNYSISAVSGATSYTWSVPSGATVTSGQGSTDVSVTFGSSSGDVSVVANSGCATSLPSTLSINITGGGSGSQTFNYTGSQQSFTVPSCVSVITVKVWGGGGGGNDYCASTSGGGGGYSTSTISVTSGEVLTVVVGKGGLYRPPGSDAGPSVYGGGGLGSGLGYAAQGGGLSGIFTGNSTLTFDATGQARSLVIAGGGGGAGCLSNAGAGGGTNGIDASGTNPGHGGTQSAGGTPAYSPGNTPAGTALQGSSAGMTGDGGGGGGGGGGYFGGSCGWNGDNPTGNSGGGGGSGYAPNGTSTAGSGNTPGNSGDPNRANAGNGGTPGTNGNNGLVIISW